MENLHRVLYAEMGICVKIIRDITIPKLSAS